MFVNRVAWAISHMYQAGLVLRISRGVYRLSDEGKQLVEQTPTRVDLKLLSQYPAYQAWRSVKKKPRVQPPVTPDEEIESAIQQLHGALETDVLDRMRSAPPSFLERVVIDLLTKMGYGGGDASRGFVTGGPSDGGIDGTIREDVLGLDEVYVQTKRYAEGHAVGASDLRNFAGAIDAAGTNKGIFVTTARFSGSAKEYVKRSPKRIVLIDGEELVRLMIRHDVGVRVQTVYKTKKVDEDYFEQ